MSEGKHRDDPLGNTDELISREIPPGVDRHLVITAPTGGSAGVMPSLVYGLGEGGRKLETIFSF